MDGLILIDKPENITSFGAVAKIRKLTGQKRVGHTGTLDPMATGVLPILIGRATSLSPFLLESDKVYSARIKFGLKTDSFDITGNIIYKADEKALMNISKQEVLKALENLGKQLDFASGNSKFENKDDNYDDDSSSPQINIINNLDENKL